MIDIKLIQEKPQKIEKSAKDKGVIINVQKIISLEKEKSTVNIEVQKLREERNVAARKKNIEKGKNLKEELEGKEKKLKTLESELNIELLKLPNIPASDVKEGKDESENEVVKKVGKPAEFKFTPKDHLELGEALDIIDVRRAAKVSGTRFAYLKNEGALLEFALVQYAMDFLTKEGFAPIVPPVLIKKELIQDMGYLALGEDEMFKTKDENLFLVGTAEHAIVPMYKDEILIKKDLPKRYVGFSTSFRREAGSYGKDTKGILRVHQFDKVEMVSFTTPEEDDKENDYLLSLQEKLFQSLEISYQVVKMCTGDLGFPAARKYDLEAWIPSEKKYREVTSVSTTTDFQSRRLNIKYQEGNEKEYVHILNGTAFAIGRTIIAILENFQQEDGSINIPKVLHKYLSLTKITSKSS
ncbi:MAG TPA: serine--tRNA ligase [Patescibacteria group bacterium]|nr:serine--tRNA ligase [Patescibacteria group bacterium]